jgi:hypothetical protein
VCEEGESERIMEKKYILMNLKTYALQLILQKGIKSKMIKLAELVARIILEKYEQGFCWET